MATSPEHPAPGALDRTGFELLRLCAQPGCPVCGFVQATVTHYLDTISYEALTDLDARQRLRASLAYCAVHGQQWLSLQHTLGTALIYKDVCNDLRTILAGPAGGGGAGGSLRAKLQGVFRSGGGGSSGAGPALAAALEPGAPCPGCQQTATVEGQTVLSCAAALADPAFFAAYAGHPLGLCLPHLRGTLRVIGDAALVQRVAGAQAARLATTAAELAEVIRKYDYRFQDEPHGAEFAAPARSVEQVGGRLPTQLNPPRA